MSKANQILFELITHKTIQNQFFHSFFIFVDYYPILISSLSSIKVISSYNKSLPEAEEKLDIIKSLFPYRYQTDGVSNILSLIFLIVIGIFLLLYHGLIFLLKAYFTRQKNSGAFINKNTCFNFGC